MAQGGMIKSIAVVAGLISLLGIAVYPVVIDPKLNPEKYSAWSNLYNMLEK